MSARRRRETHAIYLIPGFFGFTNLGRFRYFVHVDRFLRERLAERGVKARVHVVRTHPTASLPAGRRWWWTRSRTPCAGARSSTWSATRRAASTRGWRSRRGWRFRRSDDVERWAGRVRSVVGVRSPQRGTPLAAYLTTRQGQRRLALLSLATSYVLRFGHLPLTALLGLAALFAREEARREGNLLDDLSQQLLADFSLARRRAVGRLLREVFEDQSLLLQLTPEGMDLFSADGARAARRPLRLGRDALATAGRRHHPRRRLRRRRPGDPRDLRADLSAELARRARPPPPGSRLPSAARSSRPTASFPASMRTTASSRRAPRCTAA